MDNEFEYLNKIDQHRFVNLQNVVPCRLHIATSLRIKSGSLACKLDKLEYYGFVYFSDVNNIEKYSSRRNRNDACSNVVFRSTGDIIYICERIVSFGAIPAQLIIEECVLFEGELRKNLVSCVSNLLSAGVKPIFSFRENHFLQEMAHGKAKSSADHVRRVLNLTDNRSVTYAPNS